MAELEHNDHGTRIALLEQARRDDKAMLQKMATDMAKIADAVARQAEDRSAFHRAFAELEEHKKIMESIGARMNKHDIEMREQTITKQALEIEDYKKQRRRVASEIVRTILIVVTTVTSAMILYHYGVKP